MLSNVLLTMDIWIFASLYDMKIHFTRAWIVVTHTSGSGVRFFLFKHRSCWFFHYQTIDKNSSRTQTVAPITLQVPVAQYCTDSKDMTNSLTSCTWSWKSCFLLLSSLLWFMELNTKQLLRIRNLSVNSAFVRSAEMVKYHFWWSWWRH